MMMMPDVPGNKMKMCKRKILKNGTARIIGILDQ
jgi:hypothetical protein